jgi:hypothetical protein
MSTVVRRRLDANHYSTTAVRETDEWAKFLTGCVEELLKAFKERQPRSRKATIPVPLGNFSHQTEHPLVESPARYDVTPHNSVIERSPKSNRIDEGISYDEPDLPRNLAATTFDFSWPSSHVEQVQSAHEQQ